MLINVIHELAALEGKVRSPSTLDHASFGLQRAEVHELTERQLSASLIPNSDLSYQPFHYLPP
jgi:hypothetical protein